MTNSANSSNDDGMAPTYIIAIILLALLLFYWIFHNQLIRAIFVVKRFELSIIMLWDGHYGMLMNWCNHVLESTVTLKQLKYLGYNISEALTVIFWSIGIILITITFFFHPNRKYRQTFAMQSLSQFIAQRFSKVYTPKNETQPNINLSTALTPIEYLQQHSLIVDKQLNLTALHNNLSQQLGKHCGNVAQESLEVSGLATAFSLYILDKRKQADKLLSYLNFEFSHHKNRLKNFINRYKLNQHLNKYAVECIAHDEIQKIIKGHHYTYTVLCSLLNTARKGGIVPASSFLWLKTINRTLWYALNNVGRKTFFSEGAAIISHWQFELSLKMPFSSPMIDNVTKALQQEYQLYESLHHDKS
ncbi:secretion/conjugation apparatus DotM-related subunit [Cysteiniphilum halobium]|uniref:secretion/conjugation apparatus DotM-related subunit n=1 Tax=Cysteiniphilum halobium TaxID=2219059 RepID=UPI003F8504EA